MAFNEGKNWMKNKVNKGVKIGLPLALKSYSLRRIVGRVILAGFC